MKRLKLGIVGCGDIAGYMALVSKLVRRVTLSACCDIQGERAQAFAKRHNIPQNYRDYKTMLETAQLDAVYLAVPHHLHYEMIVSTVQAGKPVLVEKPLARTLAEGIKLTESTAGKKVGVNYQYRYDGGCYALARAVQNGALGKVHSMRINIPWHREQSYFESAPWHKTIAQAGGGTLITQGSHFLDIALWALGEAPVLAAGITKNSGFNVEVDTLAHGILETRGGTLISVTSSMLAAKELAVSIEVYGERGTAVYRNLPWPRVKFVGVKARKERPPVRGVHALQRSLAGFVGWALDEEPYLTPVDESLPVLAAVEGIYRSARSGCREAL